ncbi:hypothetical protein LX64_01126 [Chitinophaga skermanii]|uniref:Uncharacterized protein n=1 Tax=Chitinophaga skermanii TaxID=331697 RepID=A0A327QXL8_9BACT|nr:hypothetical protein [Chitinophaga skermanii]RAJ08474.1 hypothetical protein LX64_01126 [Chitinophaga skermanii]
MKNFYPEKPMVGYLNTQVPMTEVISQLQALDALFEVKRASYIMFRIESANGTRGINNNFVGAQADGARWPQKYDDNITGIVLRNENTTNKPRLFVAFDRWQTSIDFLLERVFNRGLYVGGYAHKIAKMPVRSAHDFAVAYKRDWVTGKSTANPTSTELNGILSMYKQASKFFQAPNIS